MNLLPQDRLGKTDAPQGAATIGFRPEDAMVDAASAANGLSVDATVQGIEPVGAESFLHCETPGGRIVLRVPGRAAAQPGDRLHVSVDASKLHWFDEAGKRI